MHTTAGGQQGRIQILLLSADNQRLEPAAFTSHQQPDHPGTQGSPSLPASHTPSSLDPLKLYIVLSGGVWEFYLFLSCVTVFTQGKLQSPKKIYTLTMEEEEEEKTFRSRENLRFLLPPLILRLYTECRLDQTLNKCTATFQNVKGLRC